MKTKLRSFPATVTICALLLTITGNSDAQVKSHAALDAPGSNAKQDVIIAGFLTAVALVVLGIYFAQHHAHSLKGCVADGPKGVELQTENGQSFALFGETEGMRAGELVKVVGSRQKKVNGVTGSPSFVVARLDKSYGQCMVAPAHP